MQDIKEFSGEHRWASNFYMCPVEWDGRVWPSSEHAYQAAKSLDKGEQEKIRKCKTAGEAKKLGKLVNKRKEWDVVKLGVMKMILREKFKNPELRKKLLDTGDVYLEEGNHWGDKFWGVCLGEGHNHLGKILMAIRQEIQFEEEI